MKLLNRSSRCVVSQALMLVLLYGGVGNVFAQSECKSLAGTYEYSGQMLNRKFSFGYEIWLTKYLGFIAGQLVQPRQVVISSDPIQANVVFVDVIAHSSLGSSSYPFSVVELPQRVLLTCQAGRWFRGGRSQGGVDGAYHETEVGVFLEKNHDGNIFVDYHVKTVSGILFKKKSEYRDKLLFRKIEESE
jgi:hypothetical protein